MDQSAELAGANGSRGEAGREFSPESGNCLVTVRQFSDKTIYNIHDYRLQATTAVTVSLKEPVYGVIASYCNQAKVEGTVEGTASTQTVTCEFD